MKKILLILLLVPVITKAQTLKAGATNGANGITPKVLSDIPSLPEHKALIVIDGVIYNSDEQRTSASAVSYGNKPYPVDPDKLESINVLPGVKAMALYGSKGSKGAIIITTKKRVK